MRRHLLALVLIAGCAGISRDEELAQARELGGAAEQLVQDGGKLEDALDEAEAWLEAGRRRELDLFAARREAAPVERLRKIIAATRALEDLRAVAREIRRRAATIAASTAALEDSALDADEVRVVTDGLVTLRLQLKADRREQAIALARWQRARTALGEDAFAPPK